MSFAQIVVGSFLQALATENLGRLGPDVSAKLSLGVIFGGRSCQDFKVPSG